MADVVKSVQWNGTVDKGCATQIRPGPKRACHTRVAPVTLLRIGVQLEWRISQSHVGFQFLPVGTVHHHIFYQLLVSVQPYYPITRFGSPFRKLSMFSTVWDQNT